MTWWSRLSLSPASTSASAKARPSACHGARGPRRTAPRRAGSSAEVSVRPSARDEWRRRVPARHRRRNERAATPGCQAGWGRGRRRRSPVRSAPVRSGPGGAGSAQASEARPGPGPGSRRRRATRPDAARRSPTPARSGSARSAARLPARPSAGSASQPSRLPAPPRTPH